MRVFRVLLVIIAIVGLFLLIIWLAFGNHKNNSSQTSTQDTTMPSIGSIASSNATVSFLTDGIINGNDTHRQIDITVSKNSRTLTVYQGYQGTVVLSKAFANNQSAFEQFLSAINTAGFFTKRDTTISSPDGQCPLGYRYIYSSTNIANAPTSLWKATCSAKSGTFGGNSGTVNQLFQNQITDYNQLISGVQLN